MDETGQTGGEKNNIINSKLHECDKSTSIGEVLSQTDSRNTQGIKFESKEGLGDFLLENQINKFFDSDEFKEFFYSLGHYGKGTAISLVIIYSVAFQDETKSMDYSNCIDFVKECFHKNSYDRNNTLVNYICKKLGIKKSDTNYEQILKDYILEKIFKNGYFFHGFSSIAETSIRKDGLSTSMRLTPSEDVLEMGKIMEKYGEAFDNFYKIGKDYSCIYFDHDTRNIWMYANESPERFWLFIRNCFENYEPKGWGTDNNQYDYNRIQMKMQNFFKIKNVTEEDKINIFNFFEKNWGKYGKCEPRLAMIKKSAINDNIQFRESLDLSTLIYYLFEGVNNRYHKDISIDDIKIVKLPNPQQQ